MTLTNLLARQFRFVYETVNAPNRSTRPSRPNGGHRQPQSPGDGPLCDRALATIPPQHRLFNCVAGRRMRIAQGVPPEAVAAAFLSPSA